MKNIKTYVGSSKGMLFIASILFLLLGMEASALQDFLNWAEEQQILKKITVVCCDKDSSTHKLIKEDPRYDF